MNTKNQPRKNVKEGEFQEQFQGLSQALDFLNTSLFRVQNQNDCTNFSISLAQLEEYFYRLYFTSREDYRSSCEALLSRLYQLKRGFVTKMKEVIKTQQEPVSVSHRHRIFTGVYPRSVMRSAFVYLMQYQGQRDSLDFVRYFYRVLPMRDSLLQEGELRFFEANLSSYHPWKQHLFLRMMLKDGKLLRHQNLLSLKKEKSQRLLGILSLMELIYVMQSGGSLSQIACNESVLEEIPYLSHAHSLILVNGLSSSSLVFYRNLAVELISFSEVDEEFQDVLYLLSTDPVLKIRDTAREVLERKYSHLVLLSQVDLEAEKKKKRELEFWKDEKEPEKRRDLARKISGQITQSKPVSLKKGISLGEEEKQKISDVLKEAGIRPLRRSA